VKRPHKVTLMMSDEELAWLRALSARRGVSQATLLREVLYKERPPHGAPFLNVTPLARTNGHANGYGKTTSK
jgi:hypothetical protein